MTQIMNFKKMEVSGATKEEALAKAPFNIMGDATQAYKIWRKKQVNGVTEADKKQFMLDYLSKKSKNTPGVGFSITVESAVADTRERPYRINDFKRKGLRGWKTILQLFENLGTEEKPVRGNLILEAAGESKAEAKANAKALYTEKGLNKNVVAYYTKQVTEGEPVAFTVTYTPSKSARVGSYEVFGLESC